MAISDTVPARARNSRWFMPLLPCRESLGCKRAGRLRVVLQKLRLGYRLTRAAMCRSPAFQLEFTSNGSFSIRRTHTTDPNLPFGTQEPLRQVSDWSGRSMRPMYCRSSAIADSHSRNPRRPVKADLSHSRSTSRMTASIVAGQTSLQNVAR